MYGSLFRPSLPPALLFLHFFYSWISCVFLLLLVSRVTFSSLCVSRRGRSQFQKTIEHRTRSECQEDAEEYEERNTEREKRRRRKQRKNHSLVTCSSDFCVGNSSCLLPSLPSPSSSSYSVCVDFMCFSSRRQERREWGSSSTHISRHKNHNTLLFLWLHFFDQFSSVKTDKKFSQEFYFFHPLFRAFVILFISFFISLLCNLFIHLLPPIILRNRVSF